MEVKNIFNYKNERYAMLREPMRGVIGAYQDGNRWLDTTQEYLYIEQGLVNCARVFHEQAHKFLQEMDGFVDMLHENHLMGEYPTTEELDWQEELVDVNSAFELVVRIFDHIEDALTTFRDVANTNRHLAMGLTAEDLIVANSQKRTKFLEMWNMWNNNVKASSFDNWCKKYLED